MLSVFNSVALSCKSMVAVILFRISKITRPKMTTDVQFAQLLSINVRVEEKSLVLHLLFIYL